MAEDDDLTQRERRAQRHSQNKRRDMPANMKRSLKAYGPVAVILLLVVGAAAGIYWISSGPSDCVEDHWHATFGVFIPDEEGNPVRIDFQTPRTPGGLHYYDYSSTNLGGDSSFSMTLHMHLTGSEAQGPAALGPAQFHMENPGKCIGVRAALRVVDIEATSDSLTLTGGHLQVPGQSGTFTATGDQELSYWVESLDGSCNYQWREWSWSEVRNHQLQDGESLLVALGDYNETRIQAMQAEIPKSLSHEDVRQECLAEMVETNSASATTSDTPTVAPTGNTTMPPTDGNTTAPGPSGNATTPAPAS